MAGLSNVGGKSFGIVLPKPVKAIALAFIASAMTACTTINVPSGLALANNLASGMSSSKATPTFAGGSYDPLDVTPMAATIPTPSVEAPKVTVTTPPAAPQGATQVAPPDAEPVVTRMIYKPKTKPKHSFVLK